MRKDLFITDGPGWVLAFLGTAKKWDELKSRIYVSCRGGVLLDVLETLEKKFDCYYADYNRGYARVSGEFKKDADLKIEVLLLTLLKYMNKEVLDEK